MRLNIALLRRCAAALRDLDRGFAMMRGEIEPGSIAIANDKHDKAEQVQP